MLDGFNEVIRQIARIRNFTLYDYDNDVHATTDWKRNENVETKYLLRDWLHPKEVFTAMAGEKMLSNVFSSYFYYHGIVYSNTPQIYTNNPTRPNRIQTVYLVLEGFSKVHSKFTINEDVYNKTYFTIFDENKGLLQRYHSPSIHFINSLNLGYGDLLYLSNSELQQIPLLGKVPNEVFEFDNNIICINTTTTNEYYQIRNMKYRKVSYDEVKNSNIITIDKIWLNHMKYSDII